MQVIKSLPSLTLFAFFSLSLPFTKAALSAGDVAIVSFRSDTPDSFAFVATVDIPDNEVIKFTDNKWTDGDSFAANGATVTWTPPAGGLPKNTVVTWTSGDTTGTVTHGTVDNVVLSLGSGAGDTIYAFQGTESSPTFLYALNFIGSSGFGDGTGTSSTFTPGRLPPSLVADNAYVHIDHRDNGNYQGLTEGTKAEVLSAIANAANWAVSNDDVPPVAGPFVIGDPHLGLWDGTRVSWHGACDVVILYHPRFYNNKGLYSYIRTTMQGGLFSFVEAVGIMIGASRLEIDNMGQVLVDGKLLNNNKDPIPFAQGHNVTTFTRPNGMKVFRLALTEHFYFQIDVFHYMINIHPLQSKDKKVPTTALKEFHGMTGLLGDFASKQLVDRDGNNKKAANDSIDELAYEWQVRPHTDPVIFSNLREPIFPRKCEMPVRSSRKLRVSPALRDQAEAACENWAEDMKEMCVFDVLATGNMELAKAF